MKKTFATLSFLMLMQLTPGQAQSERHFSKMLYNEQGHLTFLSVKKDVIVSSATAESFITNNVLENKAGLRVINTDRDAEGFTNVRYAIISNGIELAQKVIIAHIKDGKLLSVNGDLTINELPSNSFALGEDAALASALNKINAEKYMWQDAAEEA